MLDMLNANGSEVPEAAFACTLEVYSTAYDGYSQAWWLDAGLSRKPSRWPRHPLKGLSDDREWECVPQTELCKTTGRPSKLPVRVEGALVVKELPAPQARIASQSRGQL